jgi:cytochrome c oxidase subunit 2
VALLAGLLLTGCGGFQSAVDPAGPQAGRVNTLWWFLFSVCAAIFLLVIGSLLYGIFGARSTHTDPGQEPRFRRSVTAALIVTVVILFAFLITSVSTGAALSSLSSRQGLVVEITGHQWWWEVRYPDQVASRTVVTANEVHIPVGVPVLFRMLAEDVIHSLWIPNLSGKRDLIPSRVTTLWIRADRPGVFRGQCAEYCGLQHAHMALYVVAEPPDRFFQWLDNQRTPAAEPGDDLRRHGQQVFLSLPCVLCHTIRGTAAAGQVAPDLTHLASRRNLAAGTLPNTLGNLAGWIADSQNVKPGNRMPPFSIPPGDMQPLLAYLEGLK